MIGLMLLTPPLRGRMSGIALSCHGQPFILLLVAKLLLKMITLMMRSLITVSLRRTLINGSLMEIIKVRIIICSSNNITSKMNAPAHITHLLLCMQTAGYLGK
jgi:hypothetical protein